MKNQNIIKSDNTTSKDLFIEGVERANIFGMQNANLWGDGFMVGAMECGKHYIKTKINVLGQKNYYLITKVHQKNDILFLCLWEK